MNTRIAGLVLAFALLPCSYAVAQTGTVRGTVTEAETGEALPGASVVLLQQDIVSGAATDVNGRYTLSSVRPGTYNLRVTFVGYQQQMQEVVVRSGETTTADFALEPGAIELEGVAVTALGFKTNRDQLGTATSNVTGNKLVQSGETSVLKALSAKAPGLNVTSFGGDPGAGARITIRGQTTIQGDNEPLIILDGIPVSNSTQGQDVDGVQQQSRLNDLNPDDIASVEVLKGAAAAALYGSRAQSGVIVITTKAGNVLNRTNVSFQSSVMIDDINQTVPLQTVYGQGSDGMYAFGSQVSWGDRIADRAGGEDVANGSAVSVGLQTGREYVPIAGGTMDNPHGGKRSRDITDHGEDIFQNGMTLDNTLSVSGGNQDMRYYLSLANTTVDGIIPENSNYQRTSIRLNADRSITKKFSVGAIANYVRVSSDRIQQGSNISGLMLGSLRTPPDYDNQDYLVNYYPNGLDGGFIPDRHRSYRNPIGAGTNPRYDNPFFTINQNTNTSLVNRITGKVNASYDPVSWVNLTARVGLDTYQDRRSIFFPIYNASFPDGHSEEENLGFYSITADLIGQLNRQLTPEIGLGVTGGFNFYHEESDRLFGELTDFANPVRFRSLENSESANILSETGQTVRRTVGTFGELAFDLYDQLFVKLTGRLDYASTFGPQADNSFFYPSATVAWQFSDLMPGNTLLSFGKLRASYAEVGREPGPYLAFTYFGNGTYFDGYTSTTLNAAAYGGGFQRFSRQASPTITPERKREFEVGTDLRFLADRLAFSGTYYFNRAKDLIFDVDVAPSTGFLTQTLNAAETENKGVELSLDLGIVNTRAFTWNANLNWWTNENTVVDLAGVQEVGLNGFIGSTSSIVEGEPFGVLYGDRWRRAAEGCTEDTPKQNCEPLSDTEVANGYTVGPEGLVLDDNGFPMSASTLGVTGDPNPDWRAGLGNTFRYKNLSLDVLWDFSVGGDVWNGTKGALYFFGTHGDQDWTTTISAEQANTLTNYNGDTVAELAGSSGTVTENADGSYTFRGYIDDFGAGQVIIDESYFLSGPGSGFTGPMEQFIEDGTFFRLREVTLGYNWRNGAVKRLGLNSIDFSVTGRNLWLITDYSGIDPETNLTGPSNGQGLDYFNNPHTRSYRFLVRFNY